MKKLVTILSSCSVALCMGGAYLVNTGPGVSNSQDVSETTIMGSLLSATGLDTSDRGLYSFKLSNPGERTLVLRGPVASYGGVAIDGVYYCNTHTSWFGMFNFYDVYGYDLTTGEQVMDYDEDDATAYFAQGGMNLDPITGDAIGLFYDSEMNNPQLALVSYNGNVPSKTILADLSDGSLSFNAFSVDAQGECWAISMEGDLYSIARQTGVCTKIGPTGYTPYAVAGAVIDKTTNKMYWTAAPADGTGLLIEVDLATGAGTLISTFDDNAQWNGLYIPAAEAPADAPGQCTDLTVDFPEGEMTGTLSVTAPSTLYDGNPGAGSLTVHTFVNGVETDARASDWGQTLTIDINLENSQPGQFDFMVYASNEAGNGPRTKLNNVWIGSDIPVAPKPSLTYGDGKMTVSWPAVTTGLNDGYINPAELRYSVFSKDTTLIVSGLDVTSYQISVPRPAGAKAYQYIVQANIGAKTSAMAKTNTIALGEIAPPYEADFTKEGLDAYTIIDANNDGIEWSLYNESPVGISIHYSEDLDMDDWLISPPLQLEAGKAYAVSFTTYSMESYYAERIEVKWGDDNTAEAMTRTILEPTLLPCMKNDPLMVTKYICPTETGRYFIGFHGISDKDKFDLILSEFKVASPISAFVPARCQELEVEADPTGQSKATINFKAPTASLSGNPLTGNMKVEIYRNDSLVSTLENVAAGSKQSYVDDVPESGEISYRLVPVNAYGAGEEASVTAYVGYHAPQAPGYANVSRTETEGEVTVEWGAVTQDVDGLEFPAGKIVYDLYLSGNETPLFTSLTSLSHTFMAVPAGTQDLVGYQIRARYENLLGESAFTPNIPVGKPYDGLFENGDFGQYVWGMSSAGGAAWSLLSDDGDGLPQAFDEDGTYFGCVGSEADDFGVLFSGLVSLENITDPSLSFATYHIAGESGTVDMNKISISVKPSDSEQWQEIWNKRVNDVAHDAGKWGVATLPLSAFEGQVIQVQFIATCVSYPLTLVDAITIGSGLEQNLAVSSIKAPARVAIGKDYNVEVSVENIGTNEVDDFIINLYQDEELCATHSFSGLQSGYTMSDTFTLRMSPLAEAPVSLYAEVVYSPDQHEEDNISSVIEVAPRQNNLPCPRSPKASVKDGEVTLSWTAPDLSSAGGAPVTEDFEDAGSFSDTYGDWIFVDLDKSPVGGLSNTDIPGVISGTTLGSFWLWDTDVLPIGASGNAHSGSHYLFSLFRYDNKQSDDWAISPELNGSAQTISFWAKSYSGSYPEHLQVLVSEGSTDPADFTILESGDIASLPNVWKKYEFSVPAGTRRFALRNYAAGAFMLMIDDVTFIPANDNADLHLSGYNVYRDGELMTPQPVSATSWKESGLDKDSRYVYQITAVYAGGDESGPTEKIIVNGDGSGINDLHGENISISVTPGHLNISNPNGEMISVMSASGFVIYKGNRQGDFSIEVPEGICVVRTGKGSSKIRTR